MKNNIRFKKIIMVSILTFFIVLPNLYAYAHSGKTDSDGGHYDETTGEYHYHHGHPEHSHTDGQCPYDFEDATNHKSDYQNNSENKSSKSKYSGKDIVGMVAFLLCVLYVIVWFIINTFFK